MEFSIGPSFQQNAPIAKVFDRNWHQITCNNSFDEISIGNMSVKGTNMWVKGIIAFNNVKINCYISTMKF